MAYMSTSRAVGALPEDYAVVQPCILNPKLATFDSPLRAISSQVTVDPLLREKGWLETVCSALLRGDDTFVNWASYHGARDPNIVRVPVLKSVLPLFKEYAATPGMALHAMTVAHAAIKYLNPAQVSVLYCDQPLYALCQSIQQLVPNLVGEEHMFVMMGGLHVEMCTQAVLGQWSDGSGWANLISRADVLTQGRAESAARGSHVTRTRYAHEVSREFLRFCTW